ncbi:MAG: hypothetical protein JKY53_14525 [Flavobacteriales bacterium]|nr:hypothetical protein [Flavobacteriales bacterium]
MKQFLAFFFAFFTFASADVSAQLLLQRKIVVESHDQSKQTLLKYVSSKAGIRFCYNPDLLSEIRIHIKKDTCIVRDLLDLVFGDRVYYLEAGNSIAILEQYEERSFKRKLKSVDARVITGKIIDADKKIGIGHVSIYQLGAKFSAVTNYGGNFYIILPKSKTDVAIRFVKLNYVDTVVIVKLTDKVIDLKLRFDKTVKNLSLEEVKHREEHNETSVEYHIIARTIVPEKQFAFGNNFTKNEVNAVQFSILPQYGSNWMMSGAVINRLSISAIGSYSASIEGVEIGAMYNIVKNDVRGFQIAAFSNVVGDRVTGVQMAGFANNVHGKVKGVQFAGVSNVVFDDFNGVQFSTFNNIVLGSVRGIQIALFDNIATQSTSIQLSGFGNVAAKESKLLQVAGFINIAGRFKGIQSAGFLNVAGGQSKGVQLSGFANIATDTLKGMQIGILNFSDTLQGASIGLFSYSKRGYHVVEIYGSDFSHVNIALKSGTNYLYNIYEAGIRLSGGKIWYNVGFGFGLRKPIGKKWFVNLSAVASAYNDTPEFEFVNWLVASSIDAEYKPKKHFSIFVGPTYNYLNVLNETSESSFVEALTIKPLKVDKGPGFSIYHWVGVRAGIRF